MIAAVTITDGVYSYGTPVAVPGAKNFKASPRGEVTPYEADNTDYLLIDGNDGYDIEFEVVYLPEDVKTVIFSMTKDANNVATEYSGVAYPLFALLGQFEGDAHARRFAYLDCYVSNRPEIEAKTSKAKEPDTTKIKVVSKPRSSDDLVMLYTTEDTDATAYGNWFTAVQEPSAGV